MASTYPIPFPRRPSRVPPLSPARPRRRPGRPSRGTPRRASPPQPPRTPPRPPPSIRPHLPVKKFPYGRALGRIVPGLGWVLLAWELYLLYSALLPGGATSAWEIDKSCGNGTDYWRKAGSARSSYFDACTEWTTFESAFPETPPFAIPDTPRPYFVEGWEKGDHVFSTLYKWKPGVAYKYSASDTGVTFEVPTSGTNYIPDEVPPYVPTLPEIRPEPQPYETPISVPDHFPQPIPALIPGLNPWLYPLPGGTPAPTPRPVPWRRVPGLPNFSPNLDPIRGPVAPGPYLPNPLIPYDPIPSNIPVPSSLLPPEAEPQTRPKRRRNRDPKTEPKPSENPPSRPRVPRTFTPRVISVPGPRVEFEPQSSPKLDPKGETRIKRPRGKERKTELTELGKTVWRLASVTGEACDSIDAFYQALPWDVRRLHERKLARKGHWFNWVNYLNHQYYSDPYFRERERGLGCDQKAALVYNNWNEVDLDAAFKNLWDNYLSDRTLGRLSKGAAKFGFDYLDAFRPVSIVTGPAL